ncbi:MAG: chorismate mutase [Bdellovibrionales bacterium]|nr:chorismate mutase [Bdellovibrionales bacterium]
MISDLDSLRSELDELNQRISQLLQQRFQKASEVALLKKSQGQELYDPLREKEMLDQLLQDIEESNLRKALQTCFEEIFKQSLSYMNKK